MKNICGLALICLFVVCLLFGCTSEKAPAKQEVEKQTDSMVVYAKSSFKIKLYGDQKEYYDWFYSWESKGRDVVGQPSGSVRSNCGEYNYDSGCDTEYTFWANKPGEAAIRFVYMDPQVASSYNKEMIVYVTVK